LHKLASYQPNAWFSYFTFGKLHVNNWYKVIYSFSL